MFMGKSICIGSVAVIAAVCLACVVDRKVSIGNKINLVALVSGLCAIVWSL